MLRCIAYAAQNHLKNVTDKISPHYIAFQFFSGKLRVDLMGDLFLFREVRSRLKMQKLFVLNTVFSFDHCMQPTPLLLGQLQQYFNGKTTITKLKKRTIEE